MTNFSLDILHQPDKSLSPAVGGENINYPKEISKINSFLNKHDNIEQRSLKYFNFVFKFQLRFLLNNEIDLFE